MQIYKFDEFLLLESGSVGFPFHLSETLVFILSLIDDDSIAKELIHLNKTKDFQNVSLVDTEFNQDYVTFIPSKYLRDNVFTNFDDENLKKRMLLRPITPSAGIWHKSRNPIKIGRLVNTLFPNKFTNSQIETFVNKFKSKNQKLPCKFELWKSIPQAYDTNNYSTKYGEANQLHNSCMNDAYDEILDFYVHNDRSVECLVLLEDEIDTQTGEFSQKIIGRALVWRTTEGDLFMDRVYFIHDKDYHSFIDYAKQHKIMYKSQNKSGYHFDFVKNGIESYIPTKIHIKYPIDTYENLPYMDTFCFGQGNYLMNYRPKTGRFIKLNGTEGEFEVYEEDEY